MFRQTELERLQLEKQRLVAESNAHRAKLAAEWRRLRSSACWAEEAGALLRRHPLGLVTLAATAGTLIARNLRHPRAALRRIRRMGKAASVAVTLWRLIRRKM